MIVFFASLFSFCRHIENLGFVYADKNVGTLDVLLSKLRPYFLMLRFDYLQKPNVHKKRFRRMREKQELLRNVNAFAANMFTVLLHLLLYHFCLFGLLASQLLFLHLLLAAFIILRIWLTV